MGCSVSTLWLDIILIPAAFWNFVLIDQTGFSCAPLLLRFVSQLFSAPSPPLASSTGPVFWARFRAFCLYL